MSILSAIGLGKKVRYAMVALGDITQEALLPGVSHTGNSVVTAFVTGDPEKARVLGKKYGVTDSYGYEQFETLLRSGTVDAIYLATPNWRHTEFAVPAELTYTLQQTVAGSGGAVSRLTLHQVQLRLYARLWGQ